MVPSLYEVGANLVAIRSLVIRIDTNLGEPFPGESSTRKHLTCASCNPGNKRGYNFKGHDCDDGMCGRVAANEVRKKPRRDKMWFDEVTQIPLASYNDTSTFTHLFDMQDDI